MSFGHTAQKSIDKVRTVNTPTSDSMSWSLRSIAHSSAATAAPTASLTSLDRLPEPATEYNYCSVLTSFNPVGLIRPHPVGYSGIYLVRAGELRAPFSSIPGVGLGGLVPRSKSTALGGFVPRTERTVFSEFVPLDESTVLGGLLPRT